MKRSVRAAIAGGAAVMGLGIVATTAHPPHTVPVAYAKVPLPAGQPIAPADLGTVLLPQTLVRADRLLTPAEAARHRPAHAIPAGSTLPATVVAVPRLPADTVALPLAIPLDQAAGVAAGDRVAVYVAPNTGSQGNGQLVAEGVRVLSVAYPAGTQVAQNPQQQGVIVLRVPVSEGALLVGRNLVLAPVGGMRHATWLAAPPITTTRSTASSSTATRPAPVSGAG